MKISELSITNSNGDLCTAHVYLANDGFEIGQVRIVTKHHVRLLNKHLLRLEWD